MPNHDANFGAKNRKRTGKDIQFFRFRSGFLSIEKIGFGSGSVCQKNSRLTGFVTLSNNTVQQWRSLFIKEQKYNCKQLTISKTLHFQKKIDFQQIDSIKTLTLSNNLRFRQN